MVVICACTYTKEQALFHEYIRGRSRGAGAIIDILNVTNSFKQTRLLDEDEFATE